MMHGWINMEFYSVHLNFHLTTKEPVLLWSVNTYHSIDLSASGVSITTIP